MRRAATPAIALILLLLGGGEGSHPQGLRRAGRPAAAASETPSFPLPGELPCDRRNGTLDGRSPGKGEIATPRIAWKHFAGATDTFVVVQPGEGDSRLALPREGAPAEEDPLADPRWGLSYPIAELAGKAQPVAHSSTTCYAHVLPDTPGLQKLEFESGFSKPTVNGQWQSCVGRCFAWRDGRWAQAWETEPVEMLFQPLPLVGDFDADGAPEVAILPWHELLLLDARTGRVKDRCRFTEGRSYGFSGAFDLDGDGRSEFVVQADFCKHVDVLGFREGKLALLWQKVIEPDISNPQKVLRVHPRPAADVDGDGKLEVLVSLYNGDGDGRWHLTLHDGLTGKVKADLPDEHLQGVVDVDGDGAAELLTVATDGSGVPAFGTLRVRSLRGGRPVTLWETGGAAWQTWDPPMAPNVNTAATFGQRDVLTRRVNGRCTVVLRRPAGGGRTALSTAVWESGGFRDEITLTAPGIEGVALDADGCLLARCTAPPGKRSQATSRGGPARVVGTSARGLPPSTVVVAHPEGEALPTILVAGPVGCEEIVAFRPPAAGRPGVEVARIRGRVQSDNWPHASRGPVVADLFGDGRRQLLTASAAPGGCARLVASDLQGREAWHHDFAAIPGTPPVWNTGGIILWQVGHFTHPRRLDVLVTTRRSMMHSEETSLLSGQDGRLLWHRDRQISNRGVGGTPFAVADLDGDGLDDAASLHPSILYLLKGSTGRDLLAKDASWEGPPGKPVYWGIPIAGPFEGDGRNSLFFATTRRSMTGLIRADGSLAWWDAFDRSPTGLPAVGDFDGDGQTEAMALGYDDGIRCYDIATGKIEWRLPAPDGRTRAATASGDIDSDGRDEALFSAGSALYCIGTEGEKGTGVLRWKIDLPAAVGPPTLANVDGSGKLAILMAGADGYVYCVR